MAKYVYNDEDNAPMNEEDLKWLKAITKMDNRDCKNCQHYDSEYCTSWDCKFVPVEKIVEDLHVTDVTDGGKKIEPLKRFEAPLPFTDPPDGCWNCVNFDYKHEACTTNWNNMDESYYNPDIDDRELTDKCEYFEKDESVRAEDVF